MASGEHCIGQVEERIPPSREEVVHLLTKAGQPFQG